LVGGSSWAEAYSNSNPIIKSEIPRDAPAVGLFVGVWFGPTNRVASAKTGLAKAIENSTNSRTPKIICLRSHNLVVDSLDFELSTGFYNFLYAGLDVVSGSMVIT